MAIELRHVGIVGQSGSGKFELLRYIIDQYNFVIIFDNEEEYLEYSTFKDFNELAKLIKEHNEHKKSKFIVRFVPIAQQSELSQLNKLCKFIWDNRNSFVDNNVRVKLVIPEIGEYALPKTHKKWMPLRTLIKRGRKYGIDIMWDTQKLSDCDNIIWGQTRFIFIFHVWANDLTYLIKKTNITELQQILRDLKEYEFIKYDTKYRTYSVHSKVPDIDD